MIAPQNYDLAIRQLALNLTPKTIREDRIRIINEIIKLSESQLSRE